jgi:RAT1-interacting protein
LSYWGVKFEQCSTWPERARPTLEARRARAALPVNNSEAYCTVLRTRLGEHALVLGAEIDCAGAAMGGHPLDGDGT